MLEAKKLADGRWVCQNCLKKFSREKKSKENPRGWITPPKFCTGKCRTQYHNSGGMSIKRFRDLVTKWAAAEAAGALERYHGEITGYIGERLDALRAELKMSSFRKRSKRHAQS